MRKFKTLKEFIIYIKKYYCIHCEGKCKQLPECRDVWLKNIEYKKEK